MLTLVRAQRRDCLRASAHTHSIDPNSKSTFHPDQKKTRQQPRDTPSPSAHLRIHIDLIPA